MEQEKIIEGPYWDYVAAAQFAAKNLNMWARLTAQAVLDGDSARAAKYAARFATFQALRDRIQDRYDATNGDLVLSYIGWRSSLDVRF